MPVQTFISAVSDEFREYRDQLNRDLTRQNVAVKVQEDFKDQGVTTLEGLNVYIQSCDIVVHLVGDMTGAKAVSIPHVADKFPPLLAALANGIELSYTQWEAWLALYHTKKLIIAEADHGAPRGPNYKPSTASIAAQKLHLKMLQDIGHYSRYKFTNCDNLAKQIAYSAILDLLAEDRRNLRLSPLSDALLDMAAMSFVDVMRLTCVAVSEAARNANQDRYWEFVDVSADHLRKFENHVTRVTGYLSEDAFSRCQQVVSELVLSNRRLNRQPKLEGDWLEFVVVLQSIANRIHEIGRIICDKYYIAKSELAGSIARSTIKQAERADIRNPDVFVRKRFQTQSSLIEEIAVNSETAQKGIYYDRDKRLAIPYFTIDRTLLKSAST